MTAASLRTIWWSITVIYVIVNYATLGVIPGIWKKINAILGGQGIILLLVIYSSIALALFVFLIFIKKERSLVRYLLLFLFIIVFLTMYLLEVNPGEKIHMFQYGTLGVLTYNALKVDFNRFGKALYLYGALICFAAGALDEMIQWFLPNRWFTWHDVLINGASGILTLLIIRFHVL
jgi:VanZ family protein